MKRKRYSMPRSMTRNAPAQGTELRREFTLDRAAVNEQARTVELSFSSEAEVERYFGVEILDHGPGSVRLGRLQNGGALLVNHDRGDQIGVVESVRIDSDRRGRATVRFGRSARAQEIFQDVVDGIRRLVSVGYRVHRTETNKRPDGVEVVRVTDWEPYEISLVSIPADESVGVGRSDVGQGSTGNEPLSNNDMNREQIIAALRARGIAFDANASTEALLALLNRSDDTGGSSSGSNSPSSSSSSSSSYFSSSSSSEPAARQRSAESTPATAPASTVQVTREAPPTPDFNATAQRAVEAERRRVADLQAIAEQVRQNGAHVDVQRAINEGVSPDQFRQTAFEAVLAHQRNYGGGGSPGLSRAERRDLSGFSISRALTALLHQRPLDGLEREMHQEAIREAAAAGISLQGNFHIPSLVLHHGRRDMTATGGSNGSEGGSLVETSHGPLIELLYARLVLRGLGAQFLTGLVGNLDLPKLVSGSSPDNKSETASASESNPTTAIVPLTPKRATTYVEVSQQLLIQSTPSAEQLIRNDLMTQLALLFEQRAINGTGASDQPTGILKTGAIGAVVGGTNGAAPTWDHIVDLETAIAVENADIGSLAYLTNPKVRGKLKKTFVDSSSNAERVWDVRAGDTPLNGYRAGVTTQVPSDLTKGSSSGKCSAIIFGNFSDLIMAQWGGISIMANPYIKDTEGLVRLTVNAYHDNVVRRPQSFAAMQDALT